MFRTVLWLSRLYLIILLKYDLIRLMVENECLLTTMVAGITMNGPASLAESTDTNWGRCVFLVTRMNLLKAVFLFGENLMR